MSIHTMTFGGVITSGTTEELSLQKFINQGDKIIGLDISTEDITVVQVNGIAGFSPYYRSASNGELSPGLQIGGDFSLRLVDYVKWLEDPTDDFMKVEGTLKFTFDQSTGANVKFVVVLIIRVD